MARAGFGGSGDYSGSFASLYSSNKDSQRAQQDADDQDAYDKWANGLMSDDEWMSYIRGRIDTYSGDPKRQEKWVTNLRKYSVVIADNQAEFAYKNGGSINQLIAYYATRLGTLDKNSTEARDLQLRVNDLQDTRSSDSITEGGQKIIDGINKGTKTYGDLQKFLQVQLRGARPNSDLFKSITKQIDSVKEQIRTNVVEGSFEKLQYEYDAGKLSGGNYAAKLRTMAVQFKDSDPKRYYQILEAAVAIGKQGAASGRSAAAHARSLRNKALNAKIDTIQADRNRTQAIIEQFDNLGPGRTGVDPVTGKPVVFNEAKIKELDHTLVKQLDELTAAYTAKGDKSAAANTQKAKASYISQNVMAHNTMSADDSTRELLVSTGKVMDHALENPDPTAAVGAIQGIAKTWQTYATSLEKQGHQTANYGGDIHRRLPSEAGETQFAGKLGMMDQVATDRLDRAKAVADAFATISRPGVTDAEVMAAAQLVMQYDSGVDAPGGAKPIYSKLIAAATQIAGNQQGLATGDVARVVQDGKVSFVRTQTVTNYTTIDGQTVPVVKKVPMIDGIDGQNTQLVDIFMDINGQPTKVQAVATRAGVAGFNAWVSSSAITVGKGAQAGHYPAGTPLTQDIIKKLQAAGQWDDLLAKGSLTQAPALDMLTVTSAAFTDKYGKTHPPETWVQDGGTGLWYKGQLPVHGALAGPDGTIPYKIGANGQPIADINWKAYGSAGGVPAPYSGTNAPEMQNLMNNDPTLVKGIKGRDASGAVTNDPQGLQWSYYDPMHSSAGAMNADSWWNDDQRDGRRQALVNNDVKSVQIAKQRQDDLMRMNLDPDEYKAWKTKSAAAGIVDAGRSFLESSGINAIARAIGISIDGTADKKPYSPPVGNAGRTKDDLLLPTATKKSSSSAPLVTLPKTTTYTGPTQKDDVALVLPATKKSPPSVPHAGKEKDDLALPKPTSTKTTVKLPPPPIIGGVGNHAKGQGNLAL